MSTLLTLRDLVVRYPTRKAGKAGFLNAVDGVSLSLQTGETLGLVGESGCGKSSLGNAIVGLSPVSEGDLLFRGTPVRWRDRQGNKTLRRAIQMIFQDPYASLNPRMSVRQTLAEALLVHRIVPRTDVAARVLELLDMVGLAAQTLDAYPHEISGGQRQRVGIARALSVQPEIIICDEAVSALDVSVQAQILNLLGELKAELGLTLLFISHDVGVIRHVSDRVAVMYLGQIQELAASEHLFTQPQHPYTRTLIASVPKYNSRAPLSGLRGDLPDPARPPEGCRFHTRCPRAVPQCRTDAQVLAKKGQARLVRCWRA